MSAPTCRVPAVRSRIECVTWCSRTTGLGSPTGRSTRNDDTRLPSEPVVVELGSTQGPAAAALAAGVGLVAVDVRADLAGLPRVLVAVRPAV